MRIRNLVAAFAAVAILAPAAMATLVSATAGNNGTIKPAGPRTGASGKAFFNVEGSANAANASWGVADFHYTVGFSVSDVTSLEVDLVESNAAFTAAGHLNFYLATDMTTSIDPGTSPLIYQTSVTPPGVDNQLGALYFLGTGAFNTTGNVNNGTVDAYSTAATLSLDAATKAFIASSLNGTGNLRLVITEVEPTVAATWAGYTNSTYAGPKMTLNVTPEPGSIAVLAMGFAGLLFRRRK